jgi:hypothetical protein
VARGHALERIGDEVPRAPLRLDAGLFLLLADPARELVADQLLGAAEQVPLRLLDGHSGDVLELSDLAFPRLLDLLLQRLYVGLAVGDALLAPLELGQTALELFFARPRSLVGLAHARAVVVQLALHLRAQSHCILPGRDFRLAARRLGVALGLIEHQLAVPLRRAERARSEQLPRNRGRDRSHNEPHQDSNGDEHGSAPVLSGLGPEDRLSTVRTVAVPIRHSARAGPFPNSAVLARPSPWDESRCLLDHQVVWIDSEMRSMQEK